MGPDFVSVAERRRSTQALDGAPPDGACPGDDRRHCSRIDGERRLSGVVSPVALLKRRSVRAVAEVDSSTPLSLDPDDELAEIAMKMADYDLTVAPVVDQRTRLLGIVTVDDLPGADDPGGVETAPLERTLERLTGSCNPSGRARW